MSVEHKNTKCAYAFLVMNGDENVPGVIAACMSLTLTRTTNDIIIMVTPDVSYDAKVLLHKTGAEISEVDYFDFKCKKLQTSYREKTHGEFSRRSMTKWSLLQYDQYDKILFINHNMIVAENIDHLFELNAPAATFSSPHAMRYKTDKDNEKETPKSDYHCIDYKKEHGDVIPAREVSNSLYSKNNSDIASFLFQGSMVLVEPSHDDFIKLQREIFNTGAFGFDSHNNADVQSLAYYYSVIGSKNWTHIHQRFNFVVHKLAWLDSDFPTVLCYDIGKSWVSTGYGKWKMFNSDILWWRMFKIAIKRYDYNYDELFAVLCDAADNDPNEITNYMKKARLDELYDRVENDRSIYNISSNPLEEVCQPWMSRYMYIIDETEIDFDYFGDASVKYILYDSKVNESKNWMEFINQNYADLKAKRANNKNKYVKNRGDSPFSSSSNSSRNNTPKNKFRSIDNKRKKKYKKKKWAK